MESTDAANLGPAGVPVPVPLVLSALWLRPPGRSSLLCDFRLGTAATV